MHCRILTLSATVLVTALGWRPVAAQSTAPRTIGFMGVLNTASGSHTNGPVTLTLALYNAPTGGTAMWSEQQTLTATNGLFTAALGSATPLPTTLDFSQAYYVGIKVQGDAAEMTPRIPLQGVPYAMFAQTVAQGSVASPQLAADAASLSKITGGAITTLPSGNVGIGNGNPATTLEVSGTNPVLRLSGNGGHGSQASLDISTYHPEPPEAGPGFRIQATDTNYSSDIDFMTKEPGGSTNPVVSRMHISDIGHVGIGTTSPTGLFDVADVAYPGELADQAQTNVDHAYSDPLLWQSFTAGKTGLLTGLTLATLNNFTGTLSIVDGAGPDGTVLEQQPIAFTGAPNAATRFDLSAPVPVTAGQQYTWVVSSDGFNYYLDFTQSDVYAGGQAGSSLGTIYPASDFFFQTYVAPAAVSNPELHVSDTGLAVGIGTSTPTAELDVRGTVKMGGNGQYYATGDSENLRLLRGLVNTDGSVNFGSGWTATHTSAGHYHLTFATPFSGLPIVTANSNTEGITISVNSYAPNGIDVTLRNLGGYVDAPWAFIAAGGK